jgi:hypothetical protein
MNARTPDEQAELEAAAAEEAAERAGEDDDGQEPTSAPEPPQEPQTEEHEARDTRGVYMVLWAPVPNDPDDQPRYRELGYYRGGTERRKTESGNGDVAKRRAFADKSNEHVREARAAGETGPIYVRAVPARSWPLEVEASGNQRPEPVFMVR